MRPGLRLGKTIELLSRVIIVNVATQIGPDEPVRPILHSPEHPGTIKRESHLVSQPVSEDFAACESDTAARQIVDREAPDARSERVAVYISRAADGNVEST